MSTTTPNDFEKVGLEDSRCSLLGELWHFINTYSRC
jgi:hypothetical protein